MRVVEPGYPPTTGPRAQGRGSLMTDVQYRILGPLEVSNGAPIRLGSHKQTVLLVALLLHANEIVSTDRLIEAIWGDEPPRTATHSIQIYVSELRKLLASPGLIETRAPGYRLQVDPSETDVGRFEALRRQEGRTALRAALDLWRGDPLADFAYESFAQPHIRRLEEARAATVEALAEAELEAEDPTALPLLMDLAERQPLREETRRLLMLSLYRHGRTAEALRVYRDFRRTLADELGLEPSPGLQTLEEQILLQEPIVGLVPNGAPDRSEDWTKARNPYKGLRAFSESDASDYFGREHLVGEVASQLEADRRLVAIVGPSGSGKSSLVRAGVLPRLRLGSEIPWSVAAMVPGRRPFEELRAALRRAAEGAAANGLGGGELGLLEGAVKALPEDGTRLLLLIDQFEELFTLTDPQHRRRFLRVLCSALSGPQDRFRLLLTMRADFYDRPLVEGDFARLFADGVTTLIPLSGAEIEAAALEPARRVGMSIGSDLIAELVADMVDQPGALPLFEYTLTELFDRRGGSQLTLPDYHAVGGLRGALIKSAENTYETLSGEQRDLARLILLHLVKAEQGNQAIRRRVALTAVRKLAADPDAVDEVLLAFGARRLLMFDRDPVAGQPTVEVTHEALLNEWPRLRDWIAERRIDLLRRDALSGSASEWVASGRDQDYLLTGSRLTSFSQWRDGTDVGLGELEAEFLDASSARRADEAAAEACRQAEADSRARRGRRRTTALVATAGLAAALLTLLAPRALDPVLNPAPESGLAFLGHGKDPTDPFGQQIFAGWDRWLADSGQRGETVVSDIESDWLAGITRLAQRGTPLIVTVGQIADAGPMLQLADEYPRTHFVMLDNDLSGPPNMSGVTFKEQEASFLAGAAAALHSETGQIGFVGGQDIPGIWRFEAGFEAGVRSVDPDARIEAVYLTPWWDNSGFSTAARGQEAAESLYRDGVDIVYHAAGYSGYGVFEAATRLGESLGRPLWAIGVDEDQHAAAARIGTLPPFHAEQWQDHILTSVVKRLDNATFETLDRFEKGTLEPGLARFGLAEDAVGLAESGGFLEPFADDLESYRREIVSGLRTVPQLPQKQTAEIYGTALAALVGVLKPDGDTILVERGFADVGYPSDRNWAPTTPWLEASFGPVPGGVVQLDQPVPSEGEVSPFVQERIAADLAAALPQADVVFSSGRCADGVAVALGPGGYDFFYTVATAMIGVADGDENGWYLVSLGHIDENTFAMVEWERLTDWDSGCV